VVGYCSTSEGGLCKTKGASPKEKGIGKKGFLSLSLSLSLPLKVVGDERKKERATNELGTKVQAAIAKKEEP
jgi:hypothetical protein